MTFPKTTATRTTLEGGLDVLSHVDSAHPVVSLQIWVETGSIHELPRPGAGLSHLLEHMVFKGTKSYSGEVLANRVEELGGSWNAYTTYDRTVYYLDGPAEAAAELLHMLFELVYLPTLPSEDYEMEREVIRREIAMGKDDPNSVGWEMMAETLYQTDGRRFPVIGDQSRFDAISHDEMREYHEGRYTMDNSFVMLSGDIDLPALLADLEKHMQDVPARRLVEATVPEERALAADVECLREFPIPICKTSACWAIPPMGHPDLPALELLASVIGGARSSVLYQELRERQELALNLSTWTWNARQGSGIFVVSTECQPDKLDQLRQEVARSIQTLDFYTMERALQRAKKQTWVAQLSTLTTASGRASDLAGNWFETRNLDFTRTYLDQVELVSVADLQRVAQQYLQHRPCVTAGLVPEGHLAPETSSTQAKHAIAPVIQLLPNKLPLITGADHKLPTINFQLIFKGGITLETEANEGIGSLYSSLLGKGTQYRSAEQFALELDEIAASLSFSGGNNTFIVSGFCLTQDIETLCDLVTECLLEPLFCPDQLEKERALLLSKIRESAQDPLRLAFWHARRDLFGDSPYRYSRLGAEESMGQLQVADLQAYHQRLITEGEATLTVYGDLTETSTSIIEDAFAELPYQSKAYTIPETTYGTQQRHITLDKEQAVVVVSYPGAHISSPDCATLEVVQDYLSSMAGPLFTELREKRGLAYYVSCNQFLGVNAGMFYFYIGTDPDRQQEALTEMQALLADIAEQGITEEELARVKAGIATQNARQDQTHSSQARAHGLNVLFGNGLGHRDEYRAQMDATTTADVRTCLQKYFTNVEPVITIVSPHHVS